MPLQKLSLANGETGDCRADIYSFGATLYHMLTGRPVFGGEDNTDVLNQHLNSVVINAGVFVDIPQGVCDFVSKVTQKKEGRAFSKLG